MNKAAMVAMMPGLSMAQQQGLPLTMVDLTLAAVECQTCQQQQSTLSQGMNNCD